MAKVLDCSSFKIYLSRSGSLQEGQGKFPAITLYFQMKLVRVMIMGTNKSQQFFFQNRFSSPAHFWRTRLSVS